MFYFIFWLVFIAVVMTLIHKSGWVGQPYLTILDGVAILSVLLWLASVLGFLHPPPGLNVSHGHRG
jgi:hypothetical protein